jgi:hypothetical protein
MAEEADESAPDVHEEVNRKKPIDKELMKNLSLLVPLFCITMTIHNKNMYV